MRLKRVRIVGFKTFADRTEIELNAPLSAIIGPNGCGKSNVVDAILWGLGETNARHLRAQTGVEVIFAGSRARKPVGYAEVTLFFDNEDGALPIEAVEVSIQRRLTRAGESSYAINGRNCRLRDVADLLADTGLGRAGYAIVSQSEIDQALAASPEQRRDWIDEAAGVMRYRARRNEAQRRLQNARTQLERVNDVLQELQIQREPLEEEARIARTYKSLAARLHELEADLLVRDLGETEADLERHRNAELAARAASSQTRAEAEAAEAELVELHQNLAQLEARLEQLATEMSEAERALERARSDRELAAGKLEGLADLEANLEQEDEQAAEARQAAAADLEQAMADEADAMSRLDALRKELSQVDAEALKLSEALKSAEAELQAKKAEHARWERARAEADVRASRRIRIAEELRGIEEALPELEGAVAEAAERLLALDSEVRRLIDQRNDLTARRDAAEEAERLSASHRRKVQEELASLMGRRRGLEATLESLEGVAQGAKAVLLAAREGLLRADYVPVGEAVEVDTELATAIETALGASAHDLIVDDERDAKQAIEFLKERRLGRATFQPIPLMRPIYPSEELKRLCRERGVRGRASELVRCDDRFRPVVDSLLGRVLVVDDLDRALALARKSGWSRIVTIDGEVVFSGGAVSGGRVARQGVGVVHRKAELAALENEIARLQSELEKVERGLTDEEYRQIAEALETLKTQLEEQQAERDEARVWKQRLEAERNAALREKERLVTEQKDLEGDEALSSEEPDLAPAEKARDEALARLAAHSADAHSAGARLQDAERQAAEAQRRRLEAERRVTRLAEAQAYRHARKETLEPERERWRLAEQEAESRYAAAEERVAQLRAERDEVRTERTSLAERRSEVERARSVALAALATHAEAIRRAEVEWTRADARRAGIVERLVQDYHMSVDEALQRLPHVHLPPEAVREVASLRKEVRAMGDVNLGAIEAYDRLTERFEELSGQRADVEASISDIEAAIRELDNLTRAKFKTAFSQVQRAFEEQFKLLFPGGEAHLELTDPQNALESGVEIQVTLPGKRPQRLDLLSGGERALSAIAFLFALIQVRPTPLVILDEVDAPLDGRNVERFIERIKAMGDSTQFVLITHNPVTIAAADLWYGVTMQEPGVSTLIAVRVPSQEIVAEVVPDAFLHKSQAFAH